MKLLFLITARGGSKGLPGKNLLPVGGVPLVGRAARLARAAIKILGCDATVVCSTDDPAIAEAARAWGADVPFLRPQALASDSARSIDVAYHALEGANESFDALVLLQPTSPLTEPEDVVGAVRLFENKGLPVISVCDAEHPAEWLFRIDERGRLAKLLTTTETLERRQNAKATFRTNGAVYVSNPVELRRHDSFFGPDTLAYVMPASRSIDIDTALDLDLARAIVGRQAVRPVTIGGRVIGEGYPSFVMAEADVNHNGDLELAKRLIDAAVDAGADAVKFQTLLREAAHRELIAHCRARGILLLSTPFDDDGCDLLDRLNVPGLTLPSTDLTNLPLLKHAARTGKPLIISTGTATLREVADAVDVVRAAGATDVILLHCVSHHRAEPADANLGAMTTLREAFGVPVGLSDHVEGDAMALAAVALGASIIEKQLTADLAAMIRRIREVEAGLGKKHVTAPAAAQQREPRVS